MRRGRAARPSRFSLEPDPIRVQQSKQRVLLASIYDRIEHAYGRVRVTLVARAGGITAQHRACVFALFAEEQGVQPILNTLHTLLS